MGDVASRPEARSQRPGATHLTLVRRDIDPAYGEVPDEDHDRDRENYGHRPPAPAQAPETRGYAQPVRIRSPHRPGQDVAVQKLSTALARQTGKPAPGWQRG